MFAISTSKYVNHGQKTETVCGEQLEHKKHQNSVVWGVTVFSGISGWQAKKTVEQILQLLRDSGQLCALTPDTQVDSVVERLSSGLRSSMMTLLT